MKKLFIYIALSFSLSIFAQIDQLAQNYFDRSDFEKALISYEDLLKSQPYNNLFFQRKIECYQQLSQFDKADKSLNEQLKRTNQPHLLVELGYNFQLQKDTVKARNYYEQSLKKVKQQPSNVYTVAATFERHSLLQYALKSYRIASETDSKLNFNYQTAILNGQLGNFELMIDQLLTESQNNAGYYIMIQNQLSRFLTEDTNGSFAASLKKALLLRAQKTQDVFWNRYLSWFFVQQKEYGKAFVQEKAIYKRETESLSTIMNLAELTMDEKETETAKEILTFVLENTQDFALKIKSHSYLLNMKIEIASEQEYESIRLELEGMMKQFGVSPYTLQLQILQAHFLAFNIKNPEAGKNVLKSALNLPLNQFQKADVKMELADILLYEEKFNQALIYYSQIEEDLKNNDVGHQASLKAAKTSYFKGDFEWALKQFKELKAASTQLIANDALELFLIINDNTVADSTHVALKKFARGDYLLYQNKTQGALLQFLAILKEDKGNEIEAITRCRLGEIYEKQNDFASALSQYQYIIDNFSDGIYADEALYFSAEIYNKQLKDVEKAKALYEKIIFNHQDSIYFVDARIKFRQLRGDTNL
ncbi:MAG: tetratricopeptide repeat protein [Flavobacterium sp.]